MRGSSARIPDLMDRKWFIKIGKRSDELFNVS